MPSRSQAQQLFVYGTLAPGQSNEHFLQSLNGIWRPAWASGVLYAEGIGPTLGYPALDIRGDDRVNGLLFTSYELTPLWPVLDDFEGEGYCRTEVTVFLADDDKPQQAFVYALDIESV